MGVSLVHCPERASKSSARSGVIPAEPRDSDNAERLTGRARIRDTQFLPSTWLDLCQPDEHTSRARPTLWLARAHSASPPYLDGNHFFSFTSRFWGALL